MDLTAWALFAAVAAVLLAGAVLHYRRREPAGSGRLALALLRGLALAILALLLFNPVVALPGAGGRGPGVALVDASLSMRLRAPDGTARWEEARAVVAEVGASRILGFGVGEAAPVPGLAALGAPDHPRTLLTPALRSALEAGPGTVVVVTDGAVEDAPEATRLMGESAGRVEVRTVGARTAWNAGLVEVEAPGWATAGEEVEIAVAVAGLGEPGPDSVGVAVVWEGETLTRAAVAAPAGGGLSTTVLRFVPPAGMSGLVRLDIALENGGSEPADDVRTRYLAVAERPAGVVLVSFTPDQEPRFLLPVLERALGVPARGWLALAPGRFIRLGVGADAGAADGEGVVRRALAAADLVVLHGLGPASPDWALAAARARPALLFPTGDVEEVPLSPGLRQPGDWYPAGELPPSPVGPFLAALVTADAPPLTGVRAATLPGGWWAPLHVRQDRRGEPRPVLAAGQAAGRRVAVALADGYWRWAFAEGQGRALYEALWAGVAGWLLEDAVAAGADAVRAAERVVPRGTPLRWAVPAAADSVRVTLHPLGGTEAGTEPPVDAPAEAPLDTVLAVTEGVATLAVVAPGHYRYEARAWLPEGPAVEGAGPITVERYSREFTRPARLGSTGRVAEASPAAERGRLLRATPWPYALVVLLLCAEWVLRRRWGLR